MDALQVREAGPTDSATLFEWRNDAHTRSASLNTDEISWESHDAWFRASLVSEKRHIFMIETSLNAETRSIGMCRFDVEGETAEVSINLDPVMRGKGLAVGALRSAITYFWNTEPRNTEVVAQVREENTASLRLFERVGFRRKSSDGVIVIFDLQKPETS
jgi:RimJ/RimL family protein N-acetyltransferase